MNKILSKIQSVSLLALTSFFSVTTLVSASNHNTAVPQTIDDVQSWIARIITLAFNLFFVLAAFFVLWAAFDYLTSGGAEAKVKSAKQKITYAILGIALAVIARAMVPLIRSFFAI